MQVFFLTFKEFGFNRVTKKTKVMLQKALPDELLPKNLQEKTHQPKKNNNNEEIQTIVFPYTLYGSEN